MKYLKAFLAVAALVGLDQWSKYMAALHLGSGSTVELIPGVFELHYLENRGSAFGLMQNQRIFFVIMTLIVVGFVCFFYTRVPDAKKFILLKGIMVLIVAGAIGNFIDRVSLGYVIDFFYFKLINFPIFNVADIYIVVGAICFLLVSIFYYQEEDYEFLSFKSNKKSEEGK